MFDTTVPIIEATSQIKLQMGQSFVLSDRCPLAAATRGLLNNTPPVQMLDADDRLVHRTP